VRAIGVVFVATAIGCSGSVYVYTPLPGFSPSSTLLFFVLGGREEVLAIHAFDGSARPDPILLALEPGTTQRVLEYDAPLAVIMDASATGVADPVAVSDDAWRLPVPKSSADLVGEAFEPGDPSALAPWLATFRVPRPPCPAAPKIRPIEGLPPGDDVTFALPFGDGALVGLVAGGLFRVSKSTARAEPFPVLPAGPAAVDHASPFGFLDGDQVVVGWGHGVEPTLELRSIDREGNVTDRSITGGFPGIHRLGGLVSGRFGSERTVMGRTLRIAPPSLAIEDLWYLDSATQTWLVVTTSTPSLPCAKADHRLIDIDGPGRGNVGLYGGPIARFDLASATPIDLGSGLVPRGRYCANALTTLAGGAQILAFRNERSITGLLWRVDADGAWEQLVGRTTPSGNAVESIGDLAVVSADGALVAVYQHAPSHPELPPRQCHEIVLPNLDPLITTIDAHTVFVGGQDHGAFLSFD